MIICAAPNTAVDHTVVVPGFQVGHVFRAQETLKAAGGKGVNVARSGQHLGAETLCMGFLGGSNGHVAADLAAKEGLNAVWTWIEGETRSCHILVDPDMQQATVVNESGPSVSPDDWARFQGDVIGQALTADCVCYSGSLPPGVPADKFAELTVGLCGKIEHDIWIDTSGAPLRAAIEIGTGRFPHRLNIKVNDDEIGAALGRQITTPQAAAAAALHLCSQGIRTVVVTLGGLGAVMVGPGGVWQAVPPPVKIKSAVGSGDAFLAGLVTALVNGATFSDSLCSAVACGTANALTVGGGNFSKDDYETLRDQIKLETIHTVRG